MTQDYEQQEPASEEQILAAGFLNGLIASVPPEKRQALNQYAQQSTSWEDVMDEAERLRSGGDYLHAHESGGPDLTRKSSGGGGLTVERYKQMTSEERKKLSPQQIDNMTNDLARRGR
jgi:hypothetical protein